MHLDSALIERLRVARTVAALTGAGVSAESGVPTFRDAQTGLWAKYDPQELATPGAFLNNPALVWQWYRWRQQLVQKAVPNPAHEALVQFEQFFPHFILITQNVDGLHRRAGSENVIELHGNIGRARCWDSGHTVSSWTFIDDQPPECPFCGSVLRPDVVWFGESLPASELSAAFRASQQSDIFFSIGTSSIIHPAASLPSMAKENGAFLVEVNTDMTPLTPLVDYFLQGPAAMILPALTAALVGK